MEFFVYLPNQISSETNEGYYFWHFLRNYILSPSVAIPSTSATINFRVVATFS